MVANFNENVWHEITTGKKEFQKILRTMIRYYEYNSEIGNESPTHVFRKEVTDLDPSQFRVYLKRYSDYEYLIYTEKTTTNSVESGVWIHIDGIRKEKEDLLMQGITNHPVFHIVSMSDLYCNHSVTSRRKKFPMDWE
jgi:hypothetical protein